MTMTHIPNDLLLLAGRVLAVFMQICMAIAAAAILLAMPILIIFQGDINTEVAREFGNAVGSFPLWASLGMLASGLIAVAMTFLFFGKLRAIIDTVGEGDPFAPQNAHRLNLMAWLLLGVQFMMIPLAGMGLTLAKWAEPMENSKVTIDAGLDITGVLLVIILFILSRVFKHGAAMRDDLEGTV